MVVNYAWDNTSWCTNTKHTGIDDVTAMTHLQSRHVCLSVLPFFASVSRANCYRPLQHHVQLDIHSSCQQSRSWSWCTNTHTHTHTHTLRWSNYVATTRYQFLMGKHLQTKIQILSFSSPIWLHNTLLSILWHIPQPMKNETTYSCKTLRHGYVPIIKL